MSRLLRISLLAIGCLVAWSAPVAAQSGSGDDDVTVVLHPKTIQRGQSAELEVTAASDRAIPAPEAPRGVTLRAVGEIMSTQIVNGRRSTRTGRTYRVVASETGRFEISVGSEKVSLEVVDRPASGSSQAAPQDDDDGGVRLVVRPATSTAYVGQRVPVQIDLLVPEGRRLSLQSLPAVSGSSFMLEEPGDKPAQDLVAIEGQAYRRFSWKSAVVPLKAGAQALDVAMKMEISVPEQRPARSGRGASLDDDDGSPFGGGSLRSLFAHDPFFDSMFGNFVQKEVTVVPRPAVVLDVKDSPADGSSRSTGAVGHWQIATSVDRRSATEGDPLSLRIEITGDGDLGSLSAPDFPASAEWKAYRAKTVETTTPKGGGRGRKVFELPLVARRSGDFDIPSLSVSSLDPDLGKFVTISSSAIPVHIEPAPAGRRSDRADGDAALGGEARPAAEVRHARLSGVPTGTVSIPWAVIAMAGVALLLVPVGLTLGWRRRSGKSGIRQAKAALRSSLKDAERAGIEANTDAFVAACAATVAAILGRDRGEIVTPADLDRLGLGGDSDLRQVCCLVNDVPFSGRRLNADEMERCLSALRNAASKERV